MSGGDEITYRYVGYAPQAVYLNGIRVGRVEYREDGWNAFDKNDTMIGFATSKSGAGRLLVDHARATS